MTISIPRGIAHRHEPEAAVNIQKLGKSAETALALMMYRRRRRHYGWELRYDPQQDCVPGFAAPGGIATPIHCDREGFVVPEFQPAAVSGLLELQVRATALGEVIDPAIEMAFPGFRDIQFFERGVNGTRFLNVSRLLAAVSGGQKVSLRGRHITWRAEMARLHLCREKISPEDRVLVISPHPDDAEIAAFGLYSETSSTVVTLTDGGLSMRYQGSERSGIKLPRDTVRRIRVWDSLTVPQLGNVPWERTISLCFPDGWLQEMHSRPDQDFRVGGELDFVDLRRLNRSPLLNGEQQACTWRSLISDLSDIIVQTKPSIIVTPHPQLDPHPDHAFATAAVCEATESAGLKEGHVFFYCAHNRGSELWPFGPKGAGVAHIPIFAEDGLCATGFYSHPLSEDRQLAKFLALEAMHDIRQIDGMGGNSLTIALGRLADELRGIMSGMGPIPTSYLRRAVRPDELFLVTSLDEARPLTHSAVANFKPPAWWQPQTNLKARLRVQ